MLVHSQEKPIHCPHCNYRCKRRWDLQKHLVSMHSGRPRRKRHEEEACTLLSEIGIIYEREKVIHFPSPAPRKFARVDVYVRALWGCIVFEVDEYAHSGYDVEYECTRMALIHRAMSAKLGGHIHLIRYNPHPIRGKRAHTPDERRAHISRALAHVPSECLTITYLFYRMASDGYPEIASSPAYRLKRYVRAMS